MKRIVVRAGWLASGMFLAVVLLEAVLRLLPVSMGLHRTQEYDRWPLVSYERATHYTYSMTWAMRNAHHGTTNNYGHIAPFDFRKGMAPVLVIGDSFIESLMNQYDATVQGVLGARIGEPEAVYGLGMSGAALSDFLALARLASDEFDPSAAIFVITDRNIADSLVDRLGYWHFALQGDTVNLAYRPLSGDGLLKRIRYVIGEISLYRYLQANVGFSVEEIFVRSRKSRTHPPDGRPRGNRQLNAVTSYFLDELGGTLKIPARCVVFLFDADRYAIYRPSLASETEDARQVREDFIAKARSHGFRAVDLEPIFRSSYAEHGRKFDYWPMDRHWNALGHEIAAAAAYKSLNDNDGVKCLRQTFAAK